MGFELIWTVCLLYSDSLEIFCELTYFLFQNSLHKYLPTINYLSHICQKPQCILKFKNTYLNLLDDTQIGIPVHSSSYFSKYALCGGDLLLSFFIKFLTSKIEFLPC